jgi:hypothetical protein
MRLFRCQACGQTIHFEDTRCECCRSLLGYLPEIGLMSALEPEVNPDLIAALHETGFSEAAEALQPGTEVWLARVWPGRRFRLCANASLQGCNWLVPVEAAAPLCTACRHNRCISDLCEGDNLARWREIERAKHRLFYSLAKLELPLRTQAEHPAGLAFDFMADPSDPTAPRVMTGHSKGLITIALREADDVEREKMRKRLGERYRTLLGHLRHEVGHYFWDQLVRGSGRLTACRAVFGDENIDYGEALKIYYAHGSSPEWQERFISAYATAHPWEDFAETWAHYLHMVDTLETAAAHGVEIHPRDGARGSQTIIDFDPYRAADFDALIGNWVPLAEAANSISRSMGQPDLYPFVLAPATIEKLRFIHGLIQEHRVSRGADWCDAEPRAAPRDAPHRSSEGHR